MPEEIINTPVKSDNSFASKLAFIYNARIGVKLKGSLENKIIYILLIDM